ncbi:MAG TPA: endo-1,3-alpha-glucanase family glycosylhydrolase [Chloroflexia bacterium]|nr:endo-1,3-alpha-glucanase family glycosylhydrolase [Chloroflexia bacterium]
MSPRSRVRWRPGRAVALLAVLLVLVTLPLGATPGRAAPPAQASDKLVLAFYYMWYGPTSFGSGQMSDRPAAPYISDHPDVIDRQVREAQAAGIDAFVSSWEGSGTEVDRNFGKLLDIAAAHNFKATIYFETNFALQHGDVLSQLRLALGTYMGHPAFLRAGGKPVVFFWQPQALGGPAAWQQVRQQIDPSHSQIWSVDTTDPAYLDVFDSIHFFSAGKWNATTDVSRVDAQWRGIVDAYNSAHGTARFWTPGVIPGWDESRVQPPRPNAKVFPRDNGALYAAGWQAAIASNPNWITITSYNEWFEGTQIEPSASYGTRYLDLTRQYVNQWKGLADPCSGGTFFPQTGHAICKQMQGYWQQYGGLAQFGYPIGDPVPEASATDGKSYRVQYFERARFELHPENAGTPYEVQLGLVGRQFHPVDPPVAAITDGHHQFFRPTGHNVSSTFYSYWQQHGGLFVNGYPISEEFAEPNADGKSYQVQYFERARFELHPENQPPYNVLLGFLGRQAWALRSSR